MSTVEERVAAGAAWLDANEPGWERRIDLATLEVADGCRCVLAQIMPEHRFYRILARLGLPGSRAIAYGFATDRGDWEALDETWVALIKERFDTGTLSDGGS